MLQRLTLIPTRNRAKTGSRTHSVLRQTIVHPLYSFFNHSCDPSTMGQIELSPTAGKTSRAVMIAIKDVKEGDEVFTSYEGPEVLALPKKIRHQVMCMPSWFGPEVCRCERCLAER